MSLLFKDSTLIIWGRHIEAVPLLFKYCTLIIWGGHIEAVPLLFKDSTLIIWEGTCHSVCSSDDAIATALCLPCRPTVTMAYTPRQ